MSSGKCFSNKTVAFLSKTSPFYLRNFPQIEPANLTVINDERDQAGEPEKLSYVRYGTEIIMVVGDRYQQDDLFNSFDLIEGCITEVYQAVRGVSKKMVFFERIAKVRRMFR